MYNRSNSDVSPSWVYSKKTGTRWGGRERGGERGRGRDERRQECELWRSVEGTRWKKELWNEGVEGSRKREDGR